MDSLIPCPGAYYIMDRGYLDFGRLYQLHSARSWFVTRAKANFKFRAAIPIRWTGRRV